MVYQSVATAAPFPRRRPRSADQHSTCSTASEAPIEPTEIGMRRSAGSSRLEMGGWQEQPLNRKAWHGPYARVHRANRSSGIKSFVVGIIACVFMLGAMETDGSGSGLALLQLPVAEAYELYNWNPDSLSSMSEDMAPDDNEEVPHLPPVKVSEAGRAPPQGTPRNQNYKVYIDDDDNISEEDIWYDDDHVSGDATYTNEHVAGAASLYRGETDGGAGQSIPDPNYRGVPSPRPTRNPTRRPPTPRPTRRPRPQPTPSPTASPTDEPTSAPVPEPPVDASSVRDPRPFPPTPPPTLAFLPTLTPTSPPTISPEPTASPTAPIPYTFTIQMTPFEITLTSMDGKLDGQQLQIFNLFSDKEIEQTWLSRKLDSLSEDDAKSLTDDYVDISFKTVVTSQLLSAPIVASSSTVEESAESTDPNGESFRQSDGDGASFTPSSSPPTPEDTLTIKSSKSSKGTPTPTAAPTVDLDDLVRGRRRTTTATVSGRRERQRQWRREFQPQRKRELKNKDNNNLAEDDIDHTSITPTSTTPAVEHTLYLQQTKTAFVTVRGEYLLKSQPDIIPTLNELDTAVQITYGLESPKLVTVLKDYDLDAFDQLHAIDFLHFFYPSTVGGVSSIIEGQKPIQKGRALSGGAKFGIFLASAVGAALLGLAAVRARTSGEEEEDHYKSKATSSGETSSDKIKRLFAAYSNKVKNKMGKKKARLSSKSPTASELGADNFLEDQYDEAVFQYEMDSYISSIGLGGVSGSFDGDMEPATYEPSGKFRSGGDGERRKVRFQEDYADYHGAPTPTAHNRSIQRWPSRDGSAGTNLDGVVYLCEKDEPQHYEEQRSTTSQGVEGIFSAK